MKWESVSNDEIDEALRQFFALRGASEAWICSIIQEVDRRQSWMADGSRTLSDWVSARLNIRHETAGLLVRIARRLVDLPHLSSRLASGELSLDQVDAISRMTTSENEKEMIEELIGLSNAHLDRAARRANPPSVEDERIVWERRALYLQWNLDESELRLHGQLPADHGGMVQEAIERAADQIPPNPERRAFDPYPSRLADGLVEVCAKTGEETGAVSRVTLHADIESLTSESEGVTELGNGALVPNETARRLACDSVVETAVHAEKGVIGVGRSRRTIPGWLRRQLHYRDAGCRFPGCGRTRYVHGHHIQHWATGGATDLDNLVLLCGYHHRFVHEHGWHITTGDRGRLEFRRPDWVLDPPPNPKLHPGLATLVAAGRST